MNPSEVLTFVLPSTLLTDEGMAAARRPFVLKPALSYKLDALLEGGFEKLFFLDGTACNLFKEILADYPSVTRGSQFLQSTPIVQMRHILQDHPEASTVLIAWGHLPLLKRDRLLEGYNHHQNTVNLGLNAHSFALSQSPTSDMVNQVYDDAIFFPRAALEYLLGFYQGSPDSSFLLTNARLRPDCTVVSAVFKSNRIEEADYLSLCAEIEESIRMEILEYFIRIGVQILAPQTVVVHPNTYLAPGVILYPGTILKKGVQVSTGAQIGPNSMLETTTVGAHAIVNASQAVGAVIGEDVSVGPFAHLRAGTILANGVKVGNFVETKKASVGQNTKLPHLSYFGDCIIGAEVNCGCGTVTANYDGVSKFVTHIGDGAFIGCQTCMVAPVTVGKGSYTAAGSVITEDVPDEALAIGRARQVVKLGRGKEKGYKA